MEKVIAFIDLEVGIDDNKIRDIGVIREEVSLHTSQIKRVSSFIEGSQYLCGHNLINHDLIFLSRVMDCSKYIPIDTLLLSPLLFPKKPYHFLVKDDKLQNDQLNNPVNDCAKAQQLFYDEVNAFKALPRDMRQILCCLLYPHDEFKGFFSYLGYKPLDTDLNKLIHSAFSDYICKNSRVDLLINKYPIELAYALSLIQVNDISSITPPWLLHNYPIIENIMGLLCNTPCENGCPYCNTRLNIHSSLKRLFGFENFRKYENEPLQENAVKAAVAGKSLLAIFPTGGGKSITFQLPALMAHETVHGLTVVISPLQSLMKDQVDNLASKGITSAVTINGLLSPIERKDALERIKDGSTSLLYISPESLRSRTIQHLLFGRNVIRFVIDEANCFSAWGQDFRVDYLYIGDFIKEYQEKKNPKKTIAISCFTATAKQKVISDIRDYFKRKLNLNLEIYASSAARTNLHYSVLFEETNESKYNSLRSLLLEKNCPTIVYVSRVQTSLSLASKLCSDGFRAEAYNGRMSSNEKIQIQDAFLENRTQIIVATSAFGMGVDKPDVRLVVHYEISPSLENYLQEAGRAGRDPNLNADCYVLFNNNDLDNHFLLLNQTKLSIGEIQQVWKAIKDHTQSHSRLWASPLELARFAGWEESGSDIETRVKTAVTALESAGYIKRGNNVPHIYATGINAASMADASIILEQSTLFTDKQRENSLRIIARLISSRSISKAQNDNAESRVDYLADTLGLSKEEVLESIGLMREEGLLSDSQDLSAYIYATDKENAASRLLSRFSRLEDFIIGYLTNESPSSFNLKELNQAAENAGIISNVRNIRTLLYFLTIKKYISKRENKETNYVEITPSLPISVLKKKCSQRKEIAEHILQYLFKSAVTRPEDDRRPVEFSLLELYKSLKNETSKVSVSMNDIEEALLYLSKISALKLEGGFFVLYNSLQIDRIVKDNHIRYKVDDYKLLNEFYQQKIQQVHIVGEYANLLVKDYDAAQQYVHDYFQMDYKRFLAKYFKEEREEEIERNITAQKYNNLFGELSQTQSKIINDDHSKYIVVMAGPGSGKTKVLTHKLASLLLMEDVKHEQLLMLTFSRAAATEFKTRLKGLIGAAANYVEIKTFHSYSFDLLGKVGSLENSDNIVKEATELIDKGEVEPGKIAKTVLVIDEAQDMDENEYNLVCSLINSNDEMRVIAVGDDDQNIFTFRGSSSKYLKRLIVDYKATTYEMRENYRSRPNLIALSNRFVSTIHNRLKTDDILPIRDEIGQAKIINHKGKNTETAVVNLLAQTYHGEKTCVLTSTNEQALLIHVLLQQKGVRSTLIQSNDYFNLYNLAEIRYFMKYIDSYLTSPIISDEQWDAAINQLSEIYSDSSCLENCQNLLSSFAGTQQKYRSDLEEFIKTSKFDDFYSDHKKEVYVSTIHKSKGREFDSVHLYLDNIYGIDDEQKRLVYVALTRARDNIFIHCHNTNLFDGYNLDNVIIANSSIDYPEPNEILLHLSLRDVDLSFYKGKKEVLLKVHSGQPLFFTDGFFTSEIDSRTVRVGKISKAFSQKLQKLQEKGYVISRCETRFVVAWQGEGDSEESAIILPSVTMTKLYM